MSLRTLNNSLTHTTFPSKHISLGVMAGRGAGEASLRPETEHKVYRDASFIPYRPALSRLFIKLCSTKSTPLHVSIISTVLVSPAFQNLTCLWFGYLQCFLTFLARHTVHIGIQLTLCSITPDSEYFPNER